MKTRDLNEEAAVGLAQLSAVEGLGLLVSSQLACGRTYAEIFGALEVVTIQLRCRMIDHMNVRERGEGLAADRAAIMEGVKS